MRLQRNLLVAAVAALIAMVVPLVASAAPPAAHPGDPELLATLPGGAGAGSTVGPGGALYVTQPATGEIWRVDPNTGKKKLYASGLPQRFDPLPFGGVMDVAFIGSTAYALVGDVGADFPADLFACNPQTDGIYRIDGPTSSTVIADIGTFACDNPPIGFPFVVPTGVQYALEPYRGGFLVTDGHHNRVLRVIARRDDRRRSSRSATSSRPGIDAVRRHGSTWRKQARFLTCRENGKIVSFEPGSSTATTVASGARLARRRGEGPRPNALRSLAGRVPVRRRSGVCRLPGAHTTPAALMKANADGTFTTVADELDQPSSLELIGTTAYVVTLGGEVWEIDDTSGAPYGKSR